MSQIIYQRSPGCRMWKPTIAPDAIMASSTS